MISKKYIFLVLILTVTYFVSVQCEEDYYKILGVPRNADEAQIKKAFRKLSLKYHPDRNKEEAAKKKYVNIAKAYEVLSDPEQKKIYDQYGEEGVKRKEQGGNPEGNFGGFHGGGGDFGNFGGFQGGGFGGSSFGNFGGGGFGFEDIFSQFFGGGFGMGGGGRQGGHSGHYHHQQQQQQRQKQQPEDLWAESRVIRLTRKNLDSLYQRNEVWLVLFYKSTGRVSQGYKDIWRELAEKFMGVIKVAAVDCIPEADEAVCETFSVFPVPKVMVFPADKKARHLTYTGPTDSEQIYSFAVSKMESYVKLVTENNFDSFIQENPDKTKVILFTSKKETPILIKALSREFKEKIAFGEVRDSSTVLTKKFKIESFPTILAIDDPDNFSGIKFQGKFQKEQIIKFLREHSSLYMTQKKPTRSLSKEFNELDPSMVRSGPCSPSDPTICLLAIFNSRETSENQKLKNILQNLAPKYANDPISFFYTSSSKLSYNASFDDVSSFPVLLILKTKRGKYAKYEGDITSENIQNFAESVLSGSASFKNMKSDLSFTSKYSDEL